LKPFDLGLRVVGLFRPALGLPDELLVVTARFFKVGEQGPALLLQRVGVEPDDTVKLLLQGVVLLQKLLVVFVHGLTSACFLAEPLLQLRRVTALDLGYGHLALRLGDLGLNLADDKLLAATVEVIAAEVAVAGVLGVGLDLMPEGLGIFFKVLFDDRGVIICIPRLQSFLRGKARFEAQNFQRLLCDHGVVRELD
jgi:hypothetical protein